MINAGLFYLSLCEAEGDDVKSRLDSLVQYLNVGWSNCEIGFKLFFSSFVPFNVETWPFSITFLFTINNQMSNRNLRRKCSLQDEAEVGYKSKT